MANNKISPPPSSVDDLSNPVWNTWFNSIQETTNANKHLSHITTADNITADKEAIIIVTSNKTVTLPAANISENTNYYVKRVTAAGAVTIASADNIDGAASITLDDNYDVAQLFCDGTTWHVVVEPAISPDELDNVTNDAQVKKISTSTDEAILRWDGTTGDTVQDSSVIIDDDNNLSGHGSTPTVVTGTTRTITAADNGEILYFTNAAAVTITLPQTSTESIPAGFQCICVQEGTGQLTLAKEGSDTINSIGSLLSSRTQYSPIAVHKRTAGSPNTWYLFGDLG